MIVVGLEQVQVVAEEAGLVMTWTEVLGAADLVVTTKMKPHLLCLLIRQGSSLVEVVKPLRKSADILELMLNCQEIVKVIQGKEFLESRASLMKFKLLFK
jgi:hypothetical protein